MNTHSQTTDEQQAANLALHLDKSNFTVPADNPQLAELLQTFAALQGTIEDPEPEYYRQLSLILLGDVPEERKSPQKWQLRLPKFQRPHWRPVWNWPLVSAVSLVLLVLFATLLPQVRSRKVAPSVSNNNSLLMTTNPFDDAPAPTYADSLRVETYSLSVADSSLADSTLLFRADTEANPNQPTDASTGITAETEGRFQADRLIQQEALLAIIVTDVAAIQADIERITTDRGGYIVNLEANETRTGHPQATISVRVPAENFTATLRQFKSLGLEVRQETVTSRDVTATYVDLESRLRNLELAEAEIGEVLAGARERGEDSAAILRIYNDLNLVREQIEQIRGQMQLIEHTTSTSLITVTLVPEEVAEELQPGEYNPAAVANRAWVNLVGILQSLSTVFIWLGIHAPLVIVPLAIILLARRLRRR